MIINLRIKIIIFFLTYFSCIFFYFLSNNNFLPLAHGPYYFSIAESLVNKIGFNFYAIYPAYKDLVYTLQIGISFIISLFLIFSKKYWFILFYFFISILWLFVYLEITKIKKIGFEKIDFLILFFILFFQPYNINQIANFSNESYYFPSFLISFLWAFKYFENIKNIKIDEPLILFTIFIIFGIYFRLHHVIFCISLFLYFVYKKNNSANIYLILVGLTQILFYFLFIKFGDMVSTFKNHENYLSVIYSELTNINSTVIKQYLFKFLKIISFPAFAEKLINNFYLRLAINFFICILIFNGFRIIKKNYYNFFLYNFLYLFLSIIFILLLPPFEYSYVLIISLQVYLAIYVCCKAIFKKYFYKLFFFTSVIFVAIVFNAYFFNVKTKLVEGYQNRKYVNLIINFYKKHSPEYYIFYFDETLLKHTEPFYWHSGKLRHCLLNVSVNRCAKNTRDKLDTNFKVIVISKREKNQKNLFIDKLIELEKNFMIQNNLELKDIVYNDVFFSYSIYDQKH